MRKVLIALMLPLLCCFVLPIPSAAAEECVADLPILMYHSISESKQGIYFVSPETLERDLVYLEGHGYTFVTASAVKAYLEGEGDLPTKSILLTFDDGHYDNLYYGYPILRKHGAHAVLNVIGCFSEYSSTHEKDHVEYSHLTWEEIAYLARSGVFEIGNHTYRMHAYKPRFGIKRKKGESEKDYRRALTEDLETLDRILLDRCGVRPVAFAYPFGAYDREGTEIVRERYDMIFTCYERINRLKRGDKEKFSSLSRINRDGTMTTDAFFKKHEIL